MSDMLSIRCEVAGCSWTTPKLSSQHYTAMVEQLKLHQNCRHQHLLESPKVAAPLSLPCSNTHWEVFLDSWKKSPARLQTVSSCERVATLLVWCGENVVSKLRNILGPHSLVKMEEGQVLEEVRVLVQHWGPSLARFYLNTRMKKEDEETVDEFMKRLEIVSQYCDYTEKCNQCGVDVNFSSQIIEDHMQVEKDLVEYCKNEYRKEEQRKSSEVEDRKEGKVVMEPLQVKDEEDGIREVSEEMEGTDGVERNEEDVGYTCSDCHKTRRFATKNGLRRHRQIFCSKSKLNGEGVQCDMCKKTFKKEKYLKNHIRFHRCQFRAKKRLESQLRRQTKITKKEENKCAEDELASSLSSDDVSCDKLGSMGGKEIVEVPMLN